MREAARRPGAASVLVFRAAAVLVAAALLPGAARAQQYPSKPIRMVVPFPPGGGTDLMARTVGQKLGEAWGQQVMVDNRGGAGGTIGTDLAAKAPGDGYTLLLGSVSTLSINPSLYAKLPFDAVRDFVPISQMASTPALVVVHPSLPARTLKELIALARARPGQLSFSSAGSGTSHHLGAEMLKLLAGIDLVHIPYKGSSPAITELIGGHVSLTVINMPAVMPMVKAGKLRPLAVAGPRRVATLPDTPTAAEAGLPGLEVDVWYGVVAPAATPKDIVAKLNTEVVRILALADVKERLAAQGADAVSSSVEAFGALIRNDLARWAKVVKASGARAE